MRTTVRFGILAASLCVTAALVWGGAGLAVLFMRWLSRHPGAAKAMSLLPVLTLPVVAIVLQRRGRTAPLA